MKKKLFLAALAFFAAAVFLLQPFGRATQAASQKAPTQEQKAEEWTRMPAGGKPAYMGIHGGTMPVSLLVANDGSSLLGFVGRTGNDFLELLRNAYLPLPSFGNSTHKKDMALKSSGVFAGNATASLPVFTLPDDPAATRTLIGRLFPFGLSPLPLSIEGALEKPNTIGREKKFRNFYLPDNFQTLKARQ